MNQHSGSKSFLAKKATQQTLPPQLRYSEIHTKPIYDEYHDDLLKNDELTEKLKNGWNVFPHQKLGGGACTTYALIEPGI